MRARNTGAIRSSALRPTWSSTRGGEPYTVALPEASEVTALQVDGDLAERAVERTDIRRVLARLKPRERSLLWLAYAQGASHREIADVLGLKTASIKLLLFRARRKAAQMLRRTSAGASSGSIFGRKS